MKKLAVLVIAFTGLTILSTGLLALPYLTLAPDATLSTASLPR